MISLKDFNSYNIHTYMYLDNGNWRHRTIEEMTDYLTNRVVGKRGFRSMAGTILEVKSISREGYQPTYECYVWWIAGVKKPTKEWVSLDKLRDISGMIASLSTDVKELQDRVDVIKEYV